MGRTKYLLTGMLGMLFSGVLYSWSILKIPFASEFGWTPDQLGINFTVTISVFAIGGYVGGRLVKKTSVSLLLIASAVLTIAGFFLCTRMTGTNIGALYIFYGGMCGFGIGIAYNAIVSVTTAWFPDKRGLCSGILMMCFGTSTLILGSIATTIMDEWGWRKGYILIGLIILTALILNAAVLKTPENFYDKKVINNETGVNDIKPDEMIRKTSFWIFCIYIVSLCAGANMVISLGNDLVSSIGANASAAALIVGILSICNGLGRLICGYLSDIIKMLSVMMIASGVALCAVSLTLFAIQREALVLCALGMALVGIGYGFSPTIISAFCSKTYGQTFFSENFSIASFTLIPCSFSASIAGKMVAVSGSYTSALILGAVLSACSFLFAFMLGDRKKVKA